MRRLFAHALTGAITPLHAKQRTQQRTRANTEKEIIHNNWGGIKGRPFFPATPLLGDPLPRHRPKQRSRQPQASKHPRSKPRRRGRATTKERGEQEAIGIPRQGPDLKSVRTRRYSATTSGPPRSTAELRPNTELRKMIATSSAPKRGSGSAPQTSQWTRNARKETARAQDNAIPTTDNRRP